MAARIVSGRRLLSTSAITMKVIPGNLKGRSGSSTEWLTRHLNDPYVKMARYKNYRARSAFKLIEIDDKYKILRPGMVVVECGAAPGAWTQVLVERLNIGKEGGQSKAQVVSIDINPFAPVDGADILPRCDFTKPINQGKILSLLDDRLVDLVCSDMAPNATGHHCLDHDAQITLVLSALRFAMPVLRPGTGNFLAKLWDGSGKDKVQSITDRFFNSTLFVKPPSCRADSSEVFLLAKEFKGINKL
ncbi:rRNA methyltransferase 2, mitochondrial [Halotydeus destructor]|nr:rRNA methyltransferase 2, mitochondrial [Halotydeus destructor]